MQVSGSRIWVIALFTFLTGCYPSRPSVLKPSSAQTTSVAARLAVRYAELRRIGTPERVTEEFSREELVRNAEYLFKHSVTHGSLQFYSDTPFDREKGQEILKEAERRLSASPIYDKNQTHLGFICNTTWRSEHFLQGKAKYGGLNYFSIVPHVFFAKSRIEDDVMLSPQDRPIAPPRTLTYYVVHEFTHSMVGQAVRENRWRSLPKWLSEGYPDYVALSPGLTYKAALANYENRDPRVHGTMAEDYMLYDVLTAHYLEREDRELSDLLSNPPDFEQAKVEAFRP